MTDEARAQQGMPRQQTVQPARKDDPVTAGGR
jgi:hypothetical protein